MTRFRILAALSAAVLALSVLPASAQQDEVDDPLGGGGDAEAQQDDTALPDDAAEGARFIGTADGGGFIVKLAEEQLTVGLSEVGVQSSTDGAACEENLACATAAGETILGETAQVGTTQGSASDSATAFDLNALEPLAVGGIGNAAANVNVDGGVTSATADGGALDLEVSLTEELLNEDVVGSLEGLLEQLLGGEDGLDQEQLDQLIGELEGQLNLESDEISGILQDAGISPGAQTQSTDGGGMATPDEVAQELVDAHEARQQDDPVEGQDNPVEGQDDPVEGEDNPVEDDQENPVEGNEEADALQEDGEEDPDTGEIASLIEDLLSSDGEQPEGPEDLLQAIENLLQDPTGQPLLTTAVGPTNSEAEDAGGVTSATGKSQGVQVVLLPTENHTLDNPDGLVSLQVGVASASVSSDRANAEADFDPALARIRVTNPLTGDVEEISVEPGQSECAGSEPLVLCVSVGHGDTTVDGSGAAASANAVSVTALGDPLPELSVELAAANAAVNAADAEVAGQEEPKDVQADANLPETGGGLLVPGLVLLGAGAAGFAGLRRRS